MENGRFSEKGKAFHKMQKKSIAFFMKIGEKQN